MEKLFKPRVRRTQSSDDVSHTHANPFFSLAPIRAEVERLQRITVCIRPFRPQGPRIEAERIADKLVVHNYGHGGSGWSLSWGSAALVLPLALTGNGREIAVLGCGALGLTAAIALQRTGARVNIYAKDLPPDVRSSRATGLWSPDSRIALTRGILNAFPMQWEQMARTSWAEFHHSADRPNSPIEFHYRYLLSDLPPDEEIAARHRNDRIGFAHLEHRLRDLYPSPADFGPGEHPFSTTCCRRLSTLRFNITAYTQDLLAQVRQAGGGIHRAEFHTPQNLASIPEPVLVNCTGYGAGALFGDDSLTPVRGQIGWLPPQPELRYSLQWDRFSVVPRADGIVVQLGASTDDTGWNDANETPNHAESEFAVRSLAAFQAAN